MCSAEYMTLQRRDSGINESVQFVRYYGNGCESIYLLNNYQERSQRSGEILVHNMTFAEYAISAIEVQTALFIRAFCKHDHYTF